MIKGFDMSVFSQPKSDLLKKILLTFSGIIFMGFGIAFNSCARLGSDPISVFSDGVHNFFNISLGSAFSVTNYALFLIVLLFGRRYINIGTFIHALFLGIFVNWGINAYAALNVPNTLFFRILMAMIACFILFFGTALLIAADIGLDVWTGLAMLLRDRTHKEYKFFRVAIDGFSLIVGYLLGGTAGIVTVVAVFLGGPIIQSFTKFIKKSIFVKLNLKKQ